MGIPKFFRYICERWPLILQLIENDNVPEFDNLYLDMNSILHSCSHGDRGDTEGIIKPLTEEEIFTRIFIYIDHLFQLIKPKKVFYMAIDGVAPRAKMNQQRSRRFRTAMENEKAMNKIIENGGVISEEIKPFDPNAITPGTTFMEKLTKYLKYFIHDKISNDINWANIEIILSGHEVPGEGEHKIMDYIRKKRSQKGYNPNLRHCIYGLDADLIILGLSTHAPHFAILREEVTFTKTLKNKKTGLELQRFYFLQLSLLREYLELEFKDIANKLKYKYDFERILDDFILILFVIGNDFLPNLPDLHLNKGAFPVILETFKLSLLSSEGYINENGTIDLKRLSTWIDYLSKFELMNFKQKEFNEEWFNKQLIALAKEKQADSKGNKLLINNRRKILSKIENWINEEVFANQLINENVELRLKRNVIIGNSDFFKALCKDLSLEIVKDKKKNEYLIHPIFKENQGEVETTELGLQYEEMKNVLKKHKDSYKEFHSTPDKLPKLDKLDEFNNESFTKMKSSYYLRKLSIDITDEEKVTDLAKNYVEGLQWVMYYYYRGCASWGWFYRYHYAPRISDIYLGLNQKIQFEKDDPFTPFQQLMAVLPERSKELIPTIFRPLMYNQDSPILDFYPSEVKLDRNGKSADWEAVVLISFVDQERLVAAMEPLLKDLEPKDARRNKFGTDILFLYENVEKENYRSPNINIFPDIFSDKCHEEIFSLEIPEKLQYGLLPGTFLRQKLLFGFPTLYTLQFMGKQGMLGCKIFENPSKQETMSLIIHNRKKEDSASIEDFSTRYLGKTIYIHWPYLKESKLHSIYNDGRFYELQFIPDKLGHKHKKFVTRSATSEEKAIMNKMKDKWSRNLKNQGGIITEPIHSLVVVNRFKGFGKSRKDALIRSYEEEVEYYPLQLVIEKVMHNMEIALLNSQDQLRTEYKIGSTFVYLGDNLYGAKAKIIELDENNKFVVEIEPFNSNNENMLKRFRIKDKENIKYYPSFVLAKMLKISSLALSRITSKYRITDMSGQQINVGLPLKNPGRDIKVEGYSRKLLNFWEFSHATLDLIISFKSTFPELFNDLTKEGPKITSAENILMNMTSENRSLLLQKARTWIKENTKDLELVPVTSKQLSGSVVREIELIVQKQKSDNSEKKPLRFSNIISQYLLNPYESSILLETQNFLLGDKVRYILKSGLVPEGSIGTVISLRTVAKLLYIDVLFDDEFLGGRTYGDVITTGRVMAVKCTSLLNLTSTSLLARGTNPKKLERSVAKIVTGSKKEVNKNSGMKQKGDKSIPVTSKKKFIFK
ncbi:hypothetical protein Kpol_1006p9 [Vanderwaltozyma polyspora DSM 70294]|uniref:5'-3' exoribonuclease 1 n=1 Tax=Vanderwaltozyma polyspora (strain ATCC 22028 / DSM 70294 / BCRC 21397 / CBS 2163 / NBRC 10782 / NRRL Y-8283 / UCD 57-17) TaxID=436907 RepID=A7TQ45_VANPO|nr:uncharacterized protein Kpol_1006p9 [Vanderwaltozyma polyspora DSM 70294]EDO15613.1 hypothetical protein Kpol_1006p9 [Vanderwaltozyma polyspora DSM 70294]